MSGDTLTMYLDRIPVDPRTAGLVWALAAACLLSAQTQEDPVRTGDFQGNPALILSNGVVELTVLPLGGVFAAVTLRDDPETVNPLWDALRADREAGRPLRNNGVLGHFACVDGFGPASSQEAKAGMPMHGEAHTLPWSTVSAGRTGKRTQLVQTVLLPRAQQNLTRTIEIADGENVIAVQSRLENLLHFDRPISWAEHGTIGSPFLEPGVTVVDISANRAITRPDRKSLEGLKNRLAAGKEFQWPMAPLEGGGEVDLRAAPAKPNSIDHTGHLHAPNQRLAFVTALHPGKRLLLGYVFRRAEFPWLQTWEFYPPQGVRARGLEFGTQAFDRPRRDVITQNRLFGELLYRWLPARSSIEARFLMFWVRTPEGFLGVDDMEFGNGELKLKDARSGQTITLAASLGI